MVNLMKLKNYYRRRYQRSGFCLFHLLHQLLSRVLTSQLTQLRNSKLASFLGTLHPKKTHFRISPGASRPLHNLFLAYLFDHGVQVFNSADKAERLTRHFELNLNVGTANQARKVNRTVNEYFRRPHP